MFLLRRFHQIKLIIGDVVILYVSLFISLAFRYFDFSILPGFYSREYLYYFTFLHAVLIFYLYLLDFYEIPPIGDIFDTLSHLLVFAGLTFITGSIFFYIVSPIITPKTTLLLYVIVLAILVFTWRTVYLLYMRNCGFKQKIIFVGSESKLKKIKPEMMKYNKGKFKLIFCDVKSVPTVANLLQGDAVAVIVLVLDQNDEKRVISEIFRCLPLGLRYITYRDFYERCFKKVSLELIDEFWFLENARRRGRIYDDIKRILDITFSIVGLLVTSLIFPFVALAIKLDSKGSILYRQKRIGKNGAIFDLIKFRTMRIDAEADGAKWAAVDDARVTLVGRFLRASHIDEFMQFYNILMGNLSFVGPRPERPEFVARLKEIIPYYDVRHILKPGLTGWAQINYKYGASIDEVKEKLRYDFYYIKHHSVVLDLGIILKTIRHMLVIIKNKRLKRLYLKMVVLFYKNCMPNKNKMRNRTFDV